MIDREAMTDRDREWEQHTRRFRAVSDRYPRRVAQAYGGDLAAAARATDTEVARRVREFEVSEGFEPTDWEAISRVEGWRT